MSHFWLPRILVTAAVLVLSCVTTTAQVTLYVDDDAVTGGNGASWSSAFTYLQDALAVAAGGDEIHVAGGIYRPDQSELGVVQPGNRAASFELIDNVTIRGGYAGLGDPGNPDVRDPNEFESILSGDLNGNDLPDFGNRTDNSYHVVVADRTVTIVTWLDGLTIEGGNANGLVSSGKGGGGALELIGSLAASNCIFRSNRAKYDGGAVYATDGSAYFVGCTFDGNKADNPTATGAWGGAVEAAGDKFTFVECRFTGNYAKSSGGAVCCEGLTSFADCVFENNQAFWGGAVAVFDANVAAYLEQCSLLSNEALYSESSGGGSGGAIYVNEAYSSLRGCLLQGNAAVRGGGAYCRDGGTLHVDGCVVSQNSVTTGDEGSGWGGGIGFWEATLELRDSRIVQNTATGWGGGVGLLADTSTRLGHPSEPAALPGRVGEAPPTPARDSQPPDSRLTFARTEDPHGVLVNCVVAGNSISSGGYYGAGVYVQAYRAEVQDCTIVGNASSCAGGGVCANFASAADFRNTIVFDNYAALSGDEGYVRGGSSVDVSYCDVESGSSGFYVYYDSQLNWGAGNISAMPLFVASPGADGVHGTDDDDLRLSPGSPCIDAGDNGAVPASVAGDIANRDRYFDDPNTVDTGSGVVPIVDIGAHEYGAPALPRAGDIDGDGVGDLWDNCPFTENADQADTDLDGIGDVCDHCDNSSGGTPPSPVELFATSVPNAANWENESQAEGDGSDGECNDGSGTYAQCLDDESWLTATEFDTFTLPGGDAISAVLVDVMCRYDHGITSGTVRMDATFPTLEPGGPGITWEFTFDSPGGIGDCDWHPDVAEDLTAARIWTPELVNDMQIAIRPVGTPDNTLRVKAFRVTIETVSQPNVVYVRPAATGAGDGSSWSDAYADLHAALAAAEPCQQVWVAAGTYTAGTVGATEPFHVPAEVGVYGGFSGWETEIWQRDHVANPTILSADLAGDDDCQTEPWGNRSENADRVLSFDTPPGQVVVDGVTIAGATQGAFALSGADGWFRNCTIEHNKSGSLVLGNVQLVDGQYVLANSEVRDNRGGYYSAAGVRAEDADLLVRASSIHDQWTDSASVVDSGEAVRVQGGRLAIQNSFVCDNETYWSEGNPEGIELFDVDTLTISHSSIDGLIGTVTGNAHIDAGVLHQIVIEGDSAQDTFSIGGHSQILGGGVSLHHDAELHLSDYAELRLQHRGYLATFGKIIVGGNAAIEDTFVSMGNVLFADNPFADPNVADSIDDCVPAALIWVQDAGSVVNNYIYSAGDRYLDRDDSVPFQGDVRNNRIVIRVDEGLNNESGGLFEARGAELVCPLPPDECPSGSQEVTAVPQFSEQTWTLDRLQLPPHAKLNILDRFETQDPNTTGGYPEVLYVRELALGANATLNAGLTRVYYELLTDDLGNPLGAPDAEGYLSNGARLVDVPVLGFSLIEVNMENDCEFLVRVQTDLGDPSMGAIGLIEHPTDPNNRVMEMRTFGGSAPCVMANAAFNKSNDAEDVTVRFDYRFVQADLDTELIVYLSGSPTPIADPNHEVARVMPPLAGRKGSVGDAAFSTFCATFPRGNVNLLQGTYVGLRLCGPNAIVEIDNWDPQVICLACADLNGSQTVDAGDFLVALAEYGQAVDPTQPEYYNRICLDNGISGDNYVGLDDLLAWDLFLSGESLNACSTGLDFGTQPPLPPRSVTLPPDTRLLIAGKPDGAGLQEDYLYPLDGSYSFLGDWPLRPASTPYEGKYRANGHLVRDAYSAIHQVHALQGLVDLDGNLTIGSQSIIAPSGDAVYVGITPSGQDLRGVPGNDVAFHPTDPNTVYVAPVVVDPIDGTPPYKAAAKLHLTSGGNVTVDLLYGANPATDDRLTYRDYDPDYGRWVYEPDFQRIREIEVDAYGNAFVLSAHAINDNDWLLLYDPAGNETCVLLGGGAPDCCESVVTDITSPSAMLVSQHDPDLLYIVRGAEPATDGSTRIYRFQIERSGDNAVGITAAGSVTLSNPVPPDLGFGHGGTVTKILEEPLDGSLVVVGFTLARFPPDADVGDGTPFDPETGEIFTLPHVAEIASATDWSGQPTIASSVLDCADLALPVSAVLLAEESPPQPGDVDGDGDVDLADLQLLLAAYGATTGDSNYNVDADFDDDGDVDLADLQFLLSNYGAVQQK